MRRLSSRNAPMETESPFLFISERTLETRHGDERSYAARRKIRKVMKAREAHHKTVLTDAEKVDASDKLVVTPAEKHSGDVSRQYQNREDLEKAYHEAKKSEARLRKILDTIPTLAWCNLPDGSNDFVNQRWCDYTGLSPEEVQRVGCKVAIHPEDLPKWLEEWRALVASGEGGEIEARPRRPDGAYRWFLIRVAPL